MGDTSYTLEQVLTAPTLKFTHACITKLHAEFTPCKATAMQFVVLSFTIAHGPPLTR